MSERDKKEAFVTLATNDTYSLGCLVLGNSLRRVSTTRQLVAMVTTGVTNSMRSQLAQVFDVIQEVDVLDSNDPINLALLGRPDLNVTFTKLHCWRLTQFEKAVFLDADTLILQNVDELFDREELSAAPDAGWPDCFNSGVFVFKPSLETYQTLLDFATSQGSFDGGDQGLLNLYFKNWATEDISKHLPFIYNVVSQAFYSYLPAFTQFKDRVKIVHFIGAVKPWHHTFNTSTRTVQPLPGTGHSQEFLQVWWNIFIETVQPYLDPSLMGLVGELASMTIQSQQTPPSPVSDAQRKLNWERGQIDYLGQDSFENIQKKIEETLNTAEPCPAPTDLASPFAPKPAEPATVKPEASSTVQVGSKSSQPPAIATKPALIKPEASSTVQVGSKSSQPPAIATKPVEPSPIKPEASSTVQVGLKTSPSPAVAPPVSKPAVPPKVSGMVRPQLTSTAKPTLGSGTAGVRPQLASPTKPTVGLGAPVRPQLSSTVKPTEAAGTSQIRPQLKPVAKPSVGAQVRPQLVSTSGAAQLKPTVPSKPTGSTQPAAKSGFSIQTTSKKK